MWQYIFGIQLYWIVLALAVILLLAVGADYNLLLISRFKEEIGRRPQDRHHPRDGRHRRRRHRGRAWCSPPPCPRSSSATCVVLGQIGTTIGLGLLFDTLIVRSFMTPSIAALLGRWFWWPLNVRPRPASQMLQPYGSRISVRRLLEPEPEPEPENAT